MSFYLPNTKIVDSGELTIAPGAIIQAEGQALVVANNNQSAGVLPSTGGATDIFVGFAVAGTSASPFVEPYYNKVETFVVPTGGVITLSLTPVSGQVFVYDNTAGAPVTGATFTGANVGNLTAGDTVTVTYKYALSILQYQALYGNVQPGGYIGSQIGQIGVIKRGEIWTTEFDASANWTTATGIYLAANGQLTTTANKGANAVAIPNSFILGTPTQNIPFLGLSFSAA